MIQDGNGHGTQNGNGSYMLRDTKWQRDIHAIGSRASKVSSAADTQTHRHTDTQTQSPGEFDLMTASSQTLGLNS